MGQRSGADAEPASPDPTITGAKIALVGTIGAAVIGAAATLTVVLLQPPSADPAPRSVGASPPSSAPPSSSASPWPSSSAGTTASPAAPDGVTYRCTGTAPAGIDISYGPSSGRSQASSLPFTAHRRLTPSARYYAITAQLKGSGQVSCTVTVTDAGATVSGSGTGRGGYNSARPQICAGLDDHWHDCG